MLLKELIKVRSKKLSFHIEKMDKESLPVAWRPRRTKKMKGTRTAKKRRIVKGNPDPPPLFLWTLAPDSPRFIAINADEIKT